VDVDIDSLNLDLHINPDGSQNWMTEELKLITSGLPFDLDKVSASNTQFLLTNHAESEILEFALEHFLVDLSEGEARAEINSAGSVDDYKFLASGKAGFDIEKSVLDLDIAFTAVQSRNIPDSELPVSPKATWFEDNSSNFPMQGQVQGSIIVQAENVQGKLSVTSSIQNLEKLIPLPPDFPGLNGTIGPIQSSGMIHINGHTVDLEIDQVLLENDQISLEATGELGNLLDTVSFNLNLSADVADLGVIKLPDGVIPEEIEAIVSSHRGTGNATISGKLEIFNVNNLEFTFSNTDQELTISGQISQLPANPSGDLNITAMIADLGKVIQLPAESPMITGVIGPITAKGVVRFNEGTLNLDDIDALLENDQLVLEATGDIHNLLENPVFELNLSADIHDLGTLVLADELVPEELDTFMENHRGTGNATLTGNLEDFSVGNMSVTVSDDNERFSISGNISQPLTNPEASVEVVFTSDNPFQLDRILPELEEFQTAAPVEIKGYINYFDQRLDFQNSVIQLGSSDMQGGVLVDLEETPARLSIKLKSNRMEIQNLGYIPEEQKAPEESQEIPEEAATGPEQAVEDPGENFKAYTSNIEINTDWVKDLNLDFHFTADQVSTKFYDVDYLELDFSAHDGIFRLNNYETLLENKPIVLKGSINAVSTPPTYEFSGDLEGETLETLMNLEEDLLSGGELKGNFSLGSAGNTLGEVIQNLDGLALLTMGPLNIRSNVLNLVSSDLFSSMLKGIMSKKEDNPTSAYDCGVLGVDISNGVAQAKKSFSLQSSDHNLGGKGKIDLNTGYVDIVVSPKARKGLGLSVSTFTGGGFKIKGHMATPNFGARGGGIATAAILGYALTPAVAAGAMVEPVSSTIIATGLVVKGIFDRLTSSNYTCKNTLKRIERHRSKASTKESGQLARKIKGY
jgi:hypothetical protein